MEILLEVEQKALLNFLFTKVATNEYTDKLTRYVEIAKRSLQKNLPIELIAEITGLTIKEVEKLKVEVSA